LKKKKKIIYRSDCPISTALDLFGDKWSLLIIRDLLFKGKNTYGDLLQGGENIATNILADRLAQLEVAGIITRAPHPDSKARVLYRLTPKGIDLAPVLVEIIAWSEKYHAVHPQAVAFAGEIRKDKAAVLSQIYQQAKGR
jgi:DNA-binding HxlR family transcriptional regulator